MAMVEELLILARPSSLLVNSRPLSDPNSADWRRMPNRKAFWSEVWQKVRPDNVAWVVDLWGYIRLWVGLLIEHLVRVLVARAGIDLWFTGAIAFIEKVAYFVSFLHFFFRFVLRLNWGRK
jgi:hypothetical protein